LRALISFLWALVAALALLCVLIVIAHRVRGEALLRSMQSYEDFTSPDYREPDLPRLNAREALDLGWAHTGPHPSSGRAIDPASSYLEFDEQKESGKLRIGVFGCSFVEGSEVARGDDLVTQLGLLLAERGVLDVEAINFGVGSYGLHQAALLWSFLGKRYDLDVVVFLAYEWDRDRDNSFLFGADSYGPVHARYALGGDQLRLLEVEGATRLEAMAVYHRLVPPLEYILYDRRAPTFVRVLLPSSARDPRNPFYLGSRNDIRKTYAAILREISREARTLIVVCDTDFICGLEGGAGLERVHFVRNQVKDLIGPDLSLHHAPRLHLSALGNRVQADQLADLLTGRPRPEADILEIALDAVRSSTRAVRRLSSYRDVSIGAGAKPISSLRFRSPDDLTGNFPRAADFGRSASLVAVETSAGLRFATSRAFGVKEAQLVAVRTDRTALGAVGRLRPMSAVIGLLVFDAVALRALGLDLLDGLAGFEEGENVLVLSARGDAPETVTLELQTSSASIALFSLSKRRSTELKSVHPATDSAALLHPCDGPLLSLRVDEAQGSHLLTLRGDEDVELFLDTDRVRIGRLRKRRSVGAPFAQPFEAIDQRGARSISK
jgi:hypothetical protein